MKHQIAEAGPFFGAMSRVDFGTCAAKSFPASSAALENGAVAKW
jgi:hypothetical protein